jgi:type IV fimbrial biogenesis protein FimT
MPYPLSLSRPRPRPAIQATRLSGFTAIELMVVVSLLAVLGALALPGFDSLIERYRIRSASGDLTAAIYLARAEAIRRGGQVTLRRTSSPDCAPAESNEWSCGWLVFADTNDNGAHEPGEERIQAWPSPTGVKANLNAGNSAGTHLRVDRWGQMAGIGAFRFTLRSRARPDDEARASVMCMSGGGRLRTVQGTSEC